MPMSYGGKSLGIGGGRALPSQPLPPMPAPEAEIPFPSLDNDLNLPSQQPTTDFLNMPPRFLAGLLSERTIMSSHAGKGFDAMGRALDAVRNRNQWRY